MSFIGPLADRMEIQELVATYCDAVTQNDAAQWAGTWAENGVWMLRDTKIAGRKTIVETWKKAMAQYSFAGFQAMVGMIAVDGHSARARVHIQENLLATDGTFRRVWGRYDDEMTKATGRWLFQSRSYNVLHSA